MHPKLGILFSGGLDSTVLAALAGDSQYQIDLINIAFDSSAPDRQTALLSFGELEHRFPGVFRLILVDIQEDEVLENEKQILAVVGPDHQKHMDFNIAAALWFAARGNGVLCEDYVVPDEVKPKRPPPHPIEERLQCAFCMLPAKPRCIHGACKLCCRKLRDQQFDAKATKKMRDFPAESQCSVHGNHEKIVEDAPIPTTFSGKPVFSEAKVLFLGTGADELLGGYARHLSAYKCRGKSGLKEEMLKDCKRLWTRNLGRDDRIISDWGKEARHPFLDEQVLQAISLIEPQVDKMMLRELCRNLGCPRAAGFEKRAIQFGSRIAQQSNKRSFGANRRAEGQEQYKPRDA